MKFGFLPDLPMPVSGLALFGVIVLAGLIGGRLASLGGWLPRITGYIAIGMLFGASGLSLLSPEMLGLGRVFVDIALGLILFELGRHLDWHWALRERWLLLTGVLESLLSFLLPFFVLVYLGHPKLLSAGVAALGIATGPAVILLVVRELGAEGQVTRRLLALTAMNNVVAIVAFTVLWAALHYEHQAGLALRVLHPLYLLGGSVLLGLAMHLLTVTLAFWVGKQRSSQFILHAGILAFAIGAAQSLHLSVPLTLLALGIMSRNLDRRYRIVPVEFGHVSHLFYVLLFVVVGATLRVDQFGGLGIAFLAFVVARLTGKMLGVLVFARRARMSWRQALLLGLALFPMAAPALAMSFSVGDFYPEFGNRLAALMVGAVAALDLVGPVVTRLALRSLGEHNPDKVLD
ncbi:MAG: cation:proton antiporter [Betaproteobacteria bacterium]|nr:cation:proton antiporter [Betaproteobacteria bacterium]